MTSLLERLQVVLERTGWSQREWSRRAKMTDERHLGVLMSRLRRDPESGVEVATITALARGAKVSESWLLTGRGSPDDTDDGPRIERDPPSPTYSDSDRPRFDNLPHWPELLTRAKVLRPAMEPWIWEAMARAKPILTADPTPLMLAELADWMQRHESALRVRDARAETGTHQAKGATRKSEE